MFEWRTASNAIYLGEDEGGKGRQFKARFLVPGLVKYDYGVCLLTKENADKFINGFTGCPVVINHQTVTDKNVKDVAVGDIFSVWFDEKDGYYWCNGILRDKEAIKLINEGYSVSCQYLITEYSDNTSGKLHNGNPYDKIIENGKPEHLAIVNNPRYEGAIIAVNALLAENEDRWITIKPNGEENKGRHLLLKDGESPAEAVRRVYGDKNQKQLFDTKEYKKTKEDFKKEDEEKQKEYDKIEERHKDSVKQEQEAAERKKENDALQMDQDAFVNKYFNSVKGDSIWKLYDYWEEKQKDKKDQSQKQSDTKDGGESILDTIERRNQQAKELKEKGVLKDIKKPKTFEERQQEDIDKGELVELGKFPTKFTSEYEEYKPKDKQSDTKDEGKEDTKKEKYVGLSEEEYSKIAKEYRDIIKTDNLTPQQVKRIKEMYPYFIKDAEYNSKDSNLNEPTREYYKKQIDKLKKEEKDLNNWFDLSKHEEKHMSQEWKKYLSDHPDEFTFDKDDKEEKGEETKQPKKLTKKEKIENLKVFVKNQIDVDLSKYVDEKYTELWGKGKGLVLDKDAMPRGTMDKIYDLQQQKYSNFSLEPLGNWAVLIKPTNKTASNGFITIDGGTENERVIWVPFEVLSEKARKHILEIADNYKDGDETKFDFSHTRVKPSEEQIKYLKDTVQDIQSKYKFKGIAQIEISSELNKGSLGVCASPNNCSVVALSPQLYNGKYNQERWDKSVKTGFHPKGTGEMIKSVLVHELGHAITCNSQNHKFWSEIEGIRKEYMKEVKKKDIEHPDFISGYARTNKFEFVAEAFSQGILAKDYGKYTKRVMETIDKHFKSEYQTKLFDAQNKNDDNTEFWIEEYGLGYPIDEEAFEEFNKEQEKQTASNAFIEEFKDTLYTALAEGIVNRLGEFLAQNKSNNSKEFNKWLDELEI